MSDRVAPPQLKRTLGLPLLVFYGLGVTVGAGIFALVGEILGLAGDFAPLSFVLAGLVAAATARAFALLSARYPTAGGEAVYAAEGFGPAAGQVAGAGVALVAVISAAALSIAFAGYVSTVLPVPAPVIVLALLAAACAVAIVGVRESVGLAAVITVIEVGTLVVVILAGLPLLAEPATWARLATLPADRAGLDVTVAAAAVAFFAFLGFENIVNMAEEAKDAERKIGQAIAITLAVTTLLYVLVALIAAASPDRAAIAGSRAPVGDLFAALTGLPAAPIVVIAAVAMINGVLAQILMGSRLCYGMAERGLLPRWLGAVSEKRRTPVRATLLVAVVVAVLALVAPMLGLAQLTGYVMLAVFTLVNLSLFRLAGRADWPGRRSQRWWGLVGAAFSVALLLYEIARQLG